MICAYGTLLNVGGSHEQGSDVHDVLSFVRVLASSVNRMDAT